MGVPGDRANKIWLVWIMWSTLLVLPFIVSQSVALAGHTVRIRHASPEFDLVIHIGRSLGGDEGFRDESLNADGDFAGAASVRIYKKGARSPFQVLWLPHITLYKRSLSYNPKLDKKPRAAWDDDYSIVFQDFNFDGHDDLAICDFTTGAYGTTSYHVYLYDPGSGKFVKSKPLTALTQDGYQGLFFVDARKRRITAYYKSGASHHYFETYRVLHNHPVLIGDEVDDGEAGTATIRSLVHGKWKTRVRRF